MRTEFVDIREIRQAGKGTQATRIRFAPPGECIDFTVYGQAIPMARPRVCHTVAGVRTFNPASSTAWKQCVALQSLEHRPSELMEGPLELELTFHLMRPKSKPRRVKLPDCKPDLDNLEKAVMDALEGLFYRNDSQIVSKTARKVYGDPPRVDVRIRGVDK